MKKARRSVLAVILPAAMLTTSASTAAVDAAVTVPASRETTPVQHSGDAADDPAIWVDPTDSSASLIIGTDKKGGLEVYDLSGNRLQRFATDFGNNVDVRRNIVVSADDQVKRLHVYRVDPATHQLEPVGDVATKIRPHGLCMYDSPTTGDLSVFANAPSGVVQQYELNVGASSVSAIARRKFDVGTAVEGCATDENNAALYISEENARTVWRYGAEPSSGTTRTVVESPATSGNIIGDAEGIAVVGSYVFVSSQGDGEFAVYDRSSNDYLGRFRVDKGATTDGCSATDGIEAYAGRLGDQFPNGLFVCQDGRNTKPGTAGKQNFKLVDLAGIMAHF